MLYATKLIYKFHGSLLTNTRTTGEVVCTVAHECQKVDDLEWGSDAVLLANGSGIHHLVAAAMSRTIDENIVSHQLTIVLVGGQHIRRNAHFTALQSQSSYHIVGLEAIRLEYRDVHRGEDVLDNGHRCTYILWRCLALCLVFGECLRAECWSVWVEGDTQVGGFLLFYHLVKRVAEAQNGRGVESFRVYSRVLNKGVISPINKSVSV